MEKLNKDEMERRWGERRRGAESNKDGGWQEVKWNACIQTVAK